MNSLAGVDALKNPGLAGMGLCSRRWHPPGRGGFSCSRLAARPPTLRRVCGLAAV